jgi:glucan 1,3-beta-glucosidase
MHHSVTLFVLVAGAIVGFWAWLGAAVPMGPSPLAPGEKLYCVSYAPFRGEQNPLSEGTRITEQQIEDDLARLAKVTDCVRTYSVEHGLDAIAPIAERLGLKVMQGLWLGGLPQKDSVQIDTVVRLANAHRDTIRSVVVGNEVLLRGEMTAAELAATIRRVKAQVPVPVTYADVWEFWLRYREVYDAVDFVTIHILPYWEDLPIAAAGAAAHVGAIRARVVASFPDKEVLLGETGWPSAGRMRDAAQPSPANQARVMHEVLAAGKGGNYRINVIEAFDQPWKRWLEGTVGGHWGLFDAKTRERKFAWGEAVSNHPYWPLQAAAGIALAALVLAAAWRARPRAGPPAAGRWVGIAALAGAGGGLIGWTAEKAALESVGPGGWMRCVFLLAVAAASPVLGGAALMRAQPLPSFAAVLGGDERPRDPIGLMLGMTLVVASALALQAALGLVFDPRYRDFPFTALTAAALPYLILAWVVPQAPKRGVAERISAAVLAASAGYIVLNESFANWQALWFAGALAMLVMGLLGPRGGRSSGSAG